jgi:protein TonB
VKLFSYENRFLTVAIGISVLVHAVVLLIKFVAPDSFKLTPSDPGLEVILVNAKHDKPPIKAEALAQANLDGGGNAEEGRSKSPLPDLHKAEEGDSLKEAKRKVVEMEEQQQKLLAQAEHRTTVTTLPTTENERPREQPQPDSPDPIDSTKIIARSEAEISKNIEDYNKRPKKTQITPSTQEVGYAMYYKTLQDRIEKIGTLNFPQQNGRKLYGELVIYIPIYQDGTIYEKDGGPRIERSSGIAALDSAAMRIVRRAAPFGVFPANMRSSGKDDVWEIITRFKFTREEALETELRGTNN